MGSPDLSCRRDNFEGWPSHWKSLGGLCCMRCTQKRLDRSSRFYTVHPCDKHIEHTDIQTTLRAASVVIGCIYRQRIAVIIFNESSRYYFVRISPTNARLHCICLAHFSRITPINTEFSTLALTFGTVIRCPFAPAIFCPPAYSD